VKTFKQTMKEMDAADDLAIQMLKCVPGRKMNTLTVSNALSMILGRYMMEANDAEFDAIIKDTVNNARTVRAAMQIAHSGSSIQ